MGIMINRRRVMRLGEKSININVKTHDATGIGASLDVMTGDGEPVNIPYKSVMSIPWTNGYIQVIYGSTNWQIYAITPCLYDGQVYKSGDLIARWYFTIVKNIIITANI